MHCIKSNMKPPGAHRGPGGRSTSALMTNERAEEPSVDSNHSVDDRSARRFDRSRIADTPSDERLSNGRLGRDRSLAGIGFFRSNERPRLLDAVVPLNRDRRAESDLIFVLDVLHNFSAIQDLFELVD